MLALCLMLKVTYYAFNYAGIIGLGLTSTTFYFINVYSTVALWKYLRVLKDGLPDPRGSLANEIHSSAQSKPIKKFGNSGPLTESKGKSWSFLISSCLPLNTSLHGTSSPPQGRSAEYLLAPITIQSIVPFLNKNNEQIFDCALGRWPTITSSFTTATAYLAIQFVGSFSQTRYSSISGVYILW